MVKHLVEEPSVFSRRHSNKKKRAGKESIAELLLSGKMDGEHIKKLTDLALKGAIGKKKLTLHKSNIAKKKPTKNVAKKKNALGKKNYEKMFEEESSSEDALPHNKGVAEKVSTAKKFGFKTALDFGDEDEDADDDDDSQKNLGRCPEMHVYSRVHLKDVAVTKTRMESGEKNIVKNTDFEIGEEAAIYPVQMTPEIHQTPEETTKATTNGPDSAAASTPIQPSTLPTLPPQPTQQAFTDAELETSGESHASKSSSKAKGSPPSTEGQMQEQTHHQRRETQGITSESNMESWDSESMDSSSFDSEEEEEERSGESYDSKLYERRRARSTKIWKAPIIVKDGHEVELNSYDSYISGPNDADVSRSHTETATNSLMSSKQSDALPTPPEKPKRSTTPGKSVPALALAIPASKAERPSLSSQQLGKPHSFFKMPMEDKPSLITLPLLGTPADYYEPDMWSSILLKENDDDNDRFRPKLDRGINDPGERATRASGRRWSGTAGSPTVSSIPVDDDVDDAEMKPRRRRRKIPTKKRRRRTAVKRRDDVFVQASTVESEEEARVMRKVFADRRETVGPKVFQMARVELAEFSQNREDFFEPIAIAPDQEDSIARSQADARDFESTNLLALKANQNGYGSGKSSVSTTGEFTAINEFEESRSDSKRTLPQQYVTPTSLGSPPPQRPQLTFTRASREVEVVQIADKEECKSAADDGIDLHMASGHEPRNGARQESAPVGRLTYELRVPRPSPSAEMRMRESVTREKPQGRGGQGTTIHWTPALRFLEAAKERAKMRGKYQYSERLGRYIYLSDSDHEERFSADSSESDEEVDRKIPRIFRRSSGSAAAASEAQGEILAPHQNISRHSSINESSEEEWHENRWSDSDDLDYDVWLARRTRIPLVWVHWEKRKALKRLAEQFKNAPDTLRKLSFRYDMDELENYARSLRIN